MKIAICGSEGYIGSAFVRFFQDHYKIIKNDPALNNLSATHDQVNEAELAIICVPTAESEDGACDTSIIDEITGWLKTRLVLIASTIPVGFVDRMNLQHPDCWFMHSPEYLGMSSYWSSYKFHSDLKEQPWYCIGGPRQATTELIDIMMPVAGPEKKYIQCTGKEAELAKYIENSFYATKVTFFHEIKMLAEMMGIDYNMVRELVLMDPRISPMHTMAMGRRPSWGGRCFPKDTAALLKQANEEGVELKVLRAAVDSNNQRKNEQQE